MNKFVFIRATVILLVVVFLPAGGWFLIRTEPDAIPARSTYKQSSLRDALDRAEQASTENALLRENLLEQGYSEDALDGFLANGAERALQLRNIAEVKEVYGVPWNMPLYVGAFTLADLYYVGNRFILGQYEDASERSVWLHMSVTEDYDTLTSGLVYAQQNTHTDFIEYIAADGKLAGFAFYVLSADGETFSRYAATASFTMEMSVANTFLGSVVDGALGKTGSD